MRKGTKEQLETIPNTRNRKRITLTEAGCTYGENLGRHCRKMVVSYLPKRVADGVLLFTRTFLKAFTNFLTGQCTEAVIRCLLVYLHHPVH